MDRDHHVLAVRLKGGRRQRLPLVPTAWDALQVNLDGRRSGALFLAQRVPLYRQEAYRIVRRVAAAADIPEKHITPHGLRRTAATILLDAGESTRAVQHMLGHRDPKTTMLYDGGRLDIDDSPVHTLGELLERTSP
jgi:integrase/recombinase XerD